MNKDVEQQIILAKEFLKDSVQYSFEIYAEIMTKLDMALNLMYTEEKKPVE